MISTSFKAAMSQIMRYTAFSLYKQHRISAIAELEQKPAAC